MVVFILAGGGGTRLWPLSRKKLPKQFLKLFGDESLFQGTLKRVLSLCPPQNILVLTNQEHLGHVKTDIAELGLKGIHVLPEPQIRNTAPAIALGMRYATQILNCHLETPILVLPSDHMMGPDDLFEGMVKKGEEIAQLGFIITFGIRPLRPETGYGYIKVKAPFEGKDGVFYVDRFVEKPDLHTAQRYISEGNYFWNSGIFLFSIGTMESEFRISAPQIYGHYESAYEELLQRFSNMPNISIDYAIMERSKKMAMVEADLFWSDVGSWDSIYDMGKKDENLNFVDSPEGSLFLHSKQNLVVSKGRLIALLGIEDAVIVDSEDALLVAKRGQTQRIREVVALLEAKGRKETQENLQERRPWGSFKSLFEGPNFKVKHILVNPNQKLSLQKHKHRAEHWVVVKGRGRFTVGEKVVELGEDQEIYIPRGELHRIESLGESPLEIIEVQYGDYLGEDDIIRVEDVYGRV